jgi:hypothetical protein
MYSWTMSAGLELKIPQNQVLRGILDLLGLTCIMTVVPKIGLELTSLRRQILSPLCLGLDQRTVDAKVLA